MGKGKILFRGVVVIAFAMALLAISFSAEAGGGNCQSKLVGNSYNCNQNEQGIGANSFTAEFETGGMSQYFDVDYGGDDYGCSCNTVGSVEVPEYDSSGDDFECISTFTGYMISGKVKGKKLSGQGTSEFGDGFIFTCKEM
jgi:hypothetical protein